MGSKNTPGMNCPCCGATGRAKIASTKREGARGSIIRRERQCRTCAFTFTTIEEITFTDAQWAKLAAAIMEGKL